MSDPQQPVFSIEKIYTKDASLEAPNAPQIFLEQVQPQIEVQLQNSAQRVADGLYEVVVTVTVTAKAGEKTCFLVADLPRAGPTADRGPAAELGPACRGRALRGGRDGHGHREGRREDLLSRRGRAGGDLSDPQRSRGRARPDSRRRLLEYPVSLRSGDGGRPDHARRLPADPSRADQLRGDVRGAQGSGGSVRRPADRGGALIRAAVLVAALAAPLATYAQFRSIAEA